MKLNLEIWRSAYAALSLSLTQTAIRHFQRERKTITHTLHNHCPLNSFPRTALAKIARNIYIKKEEERNEEPPNIKAKLNL